MCSALILAGVLNISSIIEAAGAMVMSGMVDVCRLVLM